SSRGQGITASDSKESQKQFARKPQRRRPIPAKTITWKGSITLLVQRLGNTSRATIWRGRESARRASTPPRSFWPRSIGGGPFVCLDFDFRRPGSPRARLLE